MSVAGDVLSGIIKVGEQAASKWLIARVLAGMGVVAGTWYYGVVAWLVGVAVGVVIKYGDVLGFMLIDGWETTAQGGRFLGAAEKRMNLPKDASPEEKEEAELDEMAKFADLVDMGTLPVSP